MEVYLNNNSIISITKLRPVADLVFVDRVNKRDTIIDTKIDIDTINNLFIKYHIKLLIGRGNCYTVPIRECIINIYKNKKEI